MSSAELISLLKERKFIMRTVNLLRNKVTNAPWYQKASAGAAMLAATVAQGHCDGAPVLGPLQKIADFVYQGLTIVGGLFALYGVVNIVKNLIPDEEGNRQTGSIGKGIGTFLFGVSMIAGSALVSYFTA